MSLLRKPESLDELGEEELGRARSISKSKSPPPAKRQRKRSKSGDTRVSATSKSASEKKRKKEETGGGGGGNGSATASTATSAKEKKNSGKGLKAQDADPKKHKRCKGCWLWFPRADMPDASFCWDDKRAYEYQRCFHELIFGSEIKSVASHASPWTPSRTCPWR